MDSLQIAADTLLEKVADIGGIHATENKDYDRRQVAVNFIMVSGNLFSDQVKYLRQEAGAFIAESYSGVGGLVVTAVINLQ